MATILDVGFMQNFTRLFIFIFTLIVVYGFLGKVKFFGDGKNALNGLIALMVAIFVSMATPIVAFGKVFIPIFVLLFIIIMSFAVVYNTFGSEEGGKLPQIGKEGKWIFIMFGIVLILGVAFYVFNSNTGIDEAGNPYQKNGTNINKNESQIDANYDTGIFNSKIMGLIMVLVIGAFAIRLLAGDNK